jgi:hypothetical protein
VDAATVADEQGLALVMTEGAGRARAEVSGARAIVDPAQQAPSLLVRAE